jgi:hypothetical protein
MRSSIRLAALAAACALFTLPGSARLAAQPADDESPCQVYCSALYALCVMLGGGGLCKDMREGCNFGCTIHMT